MSNVAITPARVVAALLADGWHQVVPGSFSVGPLILGDEAGPGELGFSFEEPDRGSPYRPPSVIGPLKSIQAVREVGSPGRQAGEIDRPASRQWPRPATMAVA